MFTVTSLVSRVPHHPSLTQGRDYVVVGIDDTYFRVVDDIGEPILYPKDYFLELDDEHPIDWVMVVYGEGDYFCEPKEFSERGFFERFFDQDPVAVKTFRAYCKEHGIELP